MTASPHYLTPRQAAAAIGVTLRCLADWRHLKKGPSYEKFGWVVLYHKDGLAEWTREYWKGPRAQARSISGKRPGRKPQP